VDKLKSSHVRIRVKEDELVWSKNSSLGEYTTRFGYKSMLLMQSKEPFHGVGNLYRS
jgi:hypothetical protein